MSIEALSVVLHHSRARGTAKLVLLGIANHYHPDDDRGAWPSQELLARYANTSDRQVRNAIDALVTLGEVTVESHGGQSTSRNKPNRYWITLGCPDDCDRSMNHRPTTGNLASDDRKSSAPRPEIGFQGTIIEPKENHKENKSPAKRAHRLPDDWKPDKRLLDMFDTKWPDLDRNYEIEQFTNYWHSEGKTKLDWSKAFQVWCNRNQQRRESYKQNYGTRRAQAISKAEENIARLIELERGQSE